ncbi:T9SS type A sorting domain-containing protein [Bacteroidota bacterium]
MILLEYSNGQKRYRGGGGGSHDLKDLVLKDNMPSIIVTGKGDFSSGNFGCFTVKININTGDSIWARRYTPVNTWGLDIDNNSFTNINICGSYNISSPYDYLTLSYSTNGNLRWAKTWNGPGNNIDVPYGISSDNSGNVYVTGAGTMNAMNDQDIVTIKYDSVGNEKWVRFFDSTGVYRQSYGEHIKIDPFGNVIIAGRNVTQNNYDFITLKYDPLGNLEWVKIYNGPDDWEDFIKGLAVDKYGDVYVTGDVSETTTLHKTATIKYDNNGNQKWLRIYPDYDTISGPSAIIVDKNLNVFVEGTIARGGYEDMLVLKYSQPTEIEPISSVIPKEYKLYQNYPNPFNPKSKIKMQIAKFSNVKLIVYDMLGREVAVLVNGELKPGTYEVEWDGTGNPSGIYFYKIESGTFSDIKRMVLIK